MGIYGGIIRQTKEGVEKMITKTDKAFFWMLENQEIMSRGIAQLIADRARRSKMIDSYYDDRLDVLTQYANRRIK